MASEPKKYEVARNRCNCHPETCCCNDWAVYAPGGEKWDTFFKKENADKVAKALNAVYAEDLASS
jgi:hypothetical protein